MPQQIHRRKFIAKTAAAGLALSLASDMKAYASVKADKIRVAVIGVGGRGQGHLGLLLRRNDVVVTGLADPDQTNMAAALKMVADAGKPAPKAFSNGSKDYENLVKMSELDAVIIATPWQWHIPQAIAAMKAGKIPGVEAAAPLTLKECWDVVTTSETTGIPVMMLENVCFRRDIMAVYNMVRKGIFGELVHLQGGYEHNLRSVLFDGADGVTFGANAKSEAHWRTDNYVTRNGELYSMHGLGPIATMIDVNRGNRLTRLSSMSSKAIGLHNYIVSKAGENHPNAKVKFKCGDVVTTQIQTANNQTILLTHDTMSPRPYNLGFRVQGANGLWQDYSGGGFKDGHIYLEGKSPDDEWENPEKYLQEYDHPLWKKFEKDSAGAGHGGMDFFVINNFVECIKRKVPFHLDVYDVATWYAISPLSEKSIAEGGQVQDIPDFTRGKWKTRKPVFGLDDQF